MIECGGLRILLAMTGKALIGVDADSGELLFRHEHITRFDVNATTPLYRDGRIFITSGYGTGSEMLRLAVDGKKAGVERLWQNKDLRQPSRRRDPRRRIHYGAASAAKGKWVCIDWDSGKTMYTAAGRGQRLLDLRRRDAVHAERERQDGARSGDARAARGRQPVCDSQGGQGPSWAYPVVCGGRLYVRHDDFLYAYDVKKDRRRPEAKNPKSEARNPKQNQNVKFQ